MMLFILSDYYRQLVGYPPGKGQVGYPTPTPRERSGRVSQTSDLGTPTSDILWWSLDTYSNLFTWGSLCQALGAISGSSHLYWSTYGFQADGTHPTRTLCCIFKVIADCNQNYFQSFSGLQLFMTTFLAVWPCVTEIELFWKSEYWRILWHCIVVWFLVCGRGLN